MNIQQVWTTADTNIREEPGPNGRVLDVARAGQMLELLADKEPWLNVRYGRIEGWVHVSTISVEPPEAEGSSAATSGTEPESIAAQAKVGPTRKIAPESEPAPGTFEEDFAARSRSRSDADEDIRTAQEQLAKLGYSVVADGIPGDQTIGAIRRFQADRGLDATGRLNNETRAALLKADIVETIAPEAKPPGQAAQFAVSDSEAHDIREDKLGFRNSVLALTDFLRARETKAPMAIGVCAAWGRGKTSFMRMVDGELKKASGPKAKFASTWFNPWKYDQEDQVWAAFVAQLHKKVMQEIGFWRRQRFYLKNLWQRFQFNPRTVFSLIVLGLLVWLAVKLFGPGMDDFNSALLKKVLGADVGDGEATSWFKDFVPWIAALVIVHLVYTRLTDMFGDTLLNFLKKTDYSDKVGALASFESEMRELNAAIPDNLKIIVFIDDLDRCKPKILGQIIEAMQLLEVSRKCIFVLGMDLGIVVRTIETKMKDENPEITFGISTGDTSEPVLMSALGPGSNHGYGYRFLEKIIQLRLSVPSYDADDMAELATSLGGSSAEPVQAGSRGQGIGAAAAAGDSTPEPRKGKEAADAGRREEVPSDSPEVQAAIAEYGPGYFRNPRRLKRFVNALRLHVYLARVDGLNLAVNEIARFLVLAERWPGLVDELRNAPEHLEAFHDRESEPEKGSLAATLQSNTELSELLGGNDDLGPLEHTTLERLCRWTDFQIYR